MKKFKNKNKEFKVGDLVYFSEYGNKYHGEVLEVEDTKVKCIFGDHNCKIKKKFLKIT